MSGLLYAKNYRINDAITIKIPSVGEVCDNEDEYYEGVSCITSTPYDMMVQLDDAGIDFTKISKFELFCLLFGQLQRTDTSLIFEDLDLSKFKAAINQQSNELVLLDSDSGVVIDRAIHSQISSALMTILHIEKKEKKPANDEAKRYMIKRARSKLNKLRRKQRNATMSQLENTIVALVNTEQFSYTYESVRDISIYQFYSSLDQIAHKIKYDNTMIGYYAGTVKIEELRLEDRTWLKT